MRSWPIGIVAAVGAISLVAGGSTATARAAAHTITAPAQSDHTVHMHIGDKLKVHLGSSFRRPTSTRPRVLKRTGYAGGYGTGDALTATFKALTKGRADVNATTDYPCRHTTPPCELAQQDWVVHVIVR